VPEQARRPLSRASLSIVILATPCPVLHSVVRLYAFDGEHRRRLSRALYDGWMAGCCTRPSSSIASGPLRLIAVPLWGPAARPHEHPGVLWIRPVLSPVPGPVSQILYLRTSPWRSQVRGTIIPYHIALDRYTRNADGTVYPRVNGAAGVLITGRARRGQGLQEIRGCQATPSIDVDVVL
jgi:hypothetical protein